MDVGVSRDAAVERYQQALRRLRAGIKRQYNRSVNKDLSRQQWQGLFKRNVDSVLTQLYQDTVKALRPCLADMVDVGTNSTGGLLRELDGVVEELIEYALQKHQSSCALSNFPDEHTPSQAYLFEVIQGAARGWSQFKARVDAMLAAQAPA